MIVFETPTELDLIALRTFGVSAKECDSPIGRFGTGLKYALAILAREKHDVTIRSGVMTIPIQTETREMRDQEFDLVVGAPPGESLIELGFTTKLGQDWELWQAFRELYSNTVDESGTMYRSSRAPKNERGKTTIAIAGADFEALFDERESVIISTPPIWENDDVAIHPGPCDYMFYRGIRARKLEKPSQYAYSIKKESELTEDRTFKYPYYIQTVIAKALAKCDVPEIVSQVVGLDEEDEKLEKGIDWMDTDPGDTFATVVSSKIAKGEIVRTTARAAIAKSMGKDKNALSNYSRLDLDQKAKLDRVFTWFEAIEVDVYQYPMAAAGILPGGAAAVAKRGKIYLADDAFKSDAMLVKCLVDCFASLEGYRAEAWLRERLAEALCVVGDMKDDS